MKRLSPCLLSVLALFWLHCGLPVDSAGRNLLDLERAWQYCQAFSIYQNNVPSEAEALGFFYPQEILNSLHDTLYSHSWDTTLQFAIYYPSCPFSSTGGALNKATAGTNRTVYFKRLTDSTAYLQIAQFGDSTASELKAIPVSQIGSIRHLIVDLTADPGGNLDAVTECIDILLPEKTPYLARTFRRDVINNGGAMATITDTLTAKRTIDSLNNWEGKKVAVLIDEGSASAAEILAVALADGLGTNATLMGQTSFGKAIGQYIFCFFSAEGGLEVTGFRFHRLVGPDYHEKGIAPAITLLGGADKARRWIIAAGQQLETGFLTHLSSPTVIDTVVQQRTSFGKVYVNNSDASAAKPNGRPLPAAYKKITSAPSLLF
jgi:hypothetical protein